MTQPATPALLVQPCKCKNCSKTPVVAQQTSLLVAHIANVLVLARTLTNMNELMKKAKMREASKLPETSKTSRS